MDTHVTLLLESERRVYQAIVGNIPSGLFWYRGRVHFHFQTWLPVTAKEGKGGWLIESTFGVVDLLLNDKWTAES